MEIHGFIIFQTCPKPFCAPLPKPKPRWAAQTDADGRASDLQPGGSGFKFPLKKTIQ